MKSPEMKQVLEEINQLNRKLDQIQQLIEEKLVEPDAPEEDEIEAIEDYMKNQNPEYIPLEETLKER
jgi:DNA helicase IV